MAPFDMLKRVWGLVCPVLLYEILSYLSRFLVFRILGNGDGAASLMTIVVTAVLLMPILIWMDAQDERRTDRSIRRQTSVPCEMYYLIWAVASGAAMAFLGNVVLSLTPLAEWSVRFQETQEALTSGSVWMQILASVVAAPILEEHLVRGVVYQRMRDMMGVKPSVLLSAALFGILHGNLVQGIYAFALGAYFAWLMERFQNIRVPIMAHMAANLFVILLGQEAFANRIFGSGQDFILELIVCAGCVGRAIQILKIQKN